MSIHRSKLIDCGEKLPKNPAPTSGFLLAFFLDAFGFEARFLLAGLRGAVLRLDLPLGVVFFFREVLVFLRAIIEG
jgi:hypothetical protein